MVRIWYIKKISSFISLHKPEIFAKGYNIVFFTVIWTPTRLRLESQIYNRKHSLFINNNSFLFNQYRLYKVECDDDENDVKPRLVYKTIFNTPSLDYMCFSTYNPRSTLSLPPPSSIQLWKVMYVEILLFALIYWSTHTPHILRLNISNFKFQRSSQKLETVPRPFGVENTENRSENCLNGLASGASWQRPNVCVNWILHISCAAGHI